MEETEQCGDGDKLSNPPNKWDPTAGALHAMKSCEYQSDKPCVKQQRHVDCGCDIVMRNPMRKAKAKSESMMIEGREDV